MKDANGVFEFSVEHDVDSGTEGLSWAVIQRVTPWWSHAALG